jgi:hypothetical protein
MTHTTGDPNTNICWDRSFRLQRDILQVRAQQWVAFAYEKALGSVGRTRSSRRFVHGKSQCNANPGSLKGGQDTRFKACWINLM